MTVSCTFDCLLNIVTLGFPQRLSGKESTFSGGAAEDAGSIPGSGRSPGEGHGNPLQYSSLENPMNRRAWWATVHRVAKSWIQLKPLSTDIQKSVFLFHFIFLNKTLQGKSIN